MSRFQEYMERSATILQNVPELNDLFNELKGVHADKRRDVAKNILSAYEFDSKKLNEMVDWVLEVVEKTELLVNKLRKQRGN